MYVSLMNLQHAYQLSKLRCLQSTMARLQFDLRVRFSSGSGSRTHRFILLLPVPVDFQLRKRCASIRLTAVSLAIRRESDTAGYRLGSSVPESVLSHQVREDRSMHASLRCVTFYSRPAAKIATARDRTDQCPLAPASKSSLSSDAGSTRPGRTDLQE